MSRTGPHAASIHVGGLGKFPALVPDGRHAVLGELYEVDDGVLAALDSLEGRPNFYVRKPIILAGRRRAEVYFFPAADAVGRQVIESGCWRTWSRARASRRG